MLAVMAGPSLPWHRIILVVLALTLFHGGQTLFNDVADVAVDRASTERSRQDRALVVGALSRNELVVVGTILVGAAGAVSLLLPWTNRIVFLIALPVVLSYNFKPVGLSGRPLATQVFWPVTWVLMYAYCAGGLDFDGWRRGLPYLAFTIVFMGLGEGLCQDVRDVDNDEKGGRRTTPVRFGASRTSTWALLAFVASIGPWAWHVWRSGMPPAIAAAGFACLGAWAVVAWLSVRRLHVSYTKKDGKLLHGGSIITFTAINAITLIAAVLR
ncbi:prenyltransferase [Mycobacterium sp.]|uniref:prenyltransferase n=1 Tax=Mycobacterium sp. TaxID=1785 RepID=UPI0031DFD7DA